MVLLILAGLSGVFMLASIVPMLYLQGLFLNFIKDRLNGILGFPKICAATIIDGIKLLPIYITWLLYYCIIGLVVFIIPLISVIIGLAASKPDAGAIVGGVLVVVLLYLLCCAVLFVLSPFYCYIVIKYAKLGHYTADMFNPLTVFQYMKKVFKCSILLALKLLVLGMIAGFVSGIFQVVAVILIIGFAGLAAMAPNVTLEAAMYQPQVVCGSLLVTSIVACFSMYLSFILGAIGMDNYVEIYKEELDN